MKPTATYLLLTADRVARADCTAGTWVTASAPRPEPGTEAVRAALALGGVAAAQTWVLSSEVWTQEIRLNATQVAGLSAESLRRALAFEVEPFSGIPAAEGVTGFHPLREAGCFVVAQAPRAELELAQRTLREAGGSLAGMAPGTGLPEEAEALKAWWPQVSAWLAEQPVIAPLAAQPSPHRFRWFGLGLAAAVLVVMAASSVWTARRKAGLERRHEALAEVGRGLAAMKTRVEGLRREAVALDEAAQLRQRVVARRAAVPAVLQALAALRPEDVVVTELTAEEPSQLLVRGLTLEAGAVDEFSLLLAARLAPAGWAAQTRDKVGRQSLANGGPWEFVLELNHEEAQTPTAAAAPTYDP
jgi:hypothetical protein